MGQFIPSNTLLIERTPQFECIMNEFSRHRNDDGDGGDDGDSNNNDVDEFSLRFRFSPKYSFRIAFDRSSLVLLSSTDAPFV